jgi:hypothetical protein
MADVARAGSMPDSPRRRDGGAIGHTSRQARIAAPLKSGGRPFISGFSSQ